MEESRPGYYAIIPASIRYDKRLTANAKLLYGEISALCNKEGFCWASNNYFSNLYEVSIKSISNWINQLKDLGYIDIEMIHKEDSNEIECRKISLIPMEKIFNRVWKKSSEGIEEIFHRGMEEKVKDNNIKDNNTYNNIESTSTPSFSSSSQEVRETIAEPTAEWSTPPDMPHNTDNNPHVFLSDNDRKYLREKYKECYIPTLRALNIWNRENPEFKYSAGIDGFERFVMKQGLRKPRADGLPEGTVIARI